MTHTDRIAQLESDLAVRDAARAKLMAENMRLRAALTKMAAEHEEQARAWGGEEGDVGNVKYHKQWGKFARKALKIDDRGEVAEESHG